MPTWTRRRARPLLHDPRERAGVREAVSAELVVEVGVRVEVEDRKPRILSGERPHDRIGDRVVAAERDGSVAVLEKVADRRLDARERVGAGLLPDVSGVVEGLAARAPAGSRSTAFEDSQKSASRMSGGASAAPRMYDELASERKPTRASRVTRASSPRTRRRTAGTPTRRRRTRRSRSRGRRRRARGPPPRRPPKESSSPRSE